MKKSAALRWLPDTLFGRFALLLVVAVIASHVLALTLMFELRPMPPPLHGLGPGPGPRPGIGHGPPPGPSWGLLLDIGVRLGALLFAAWIGARWLSQPISLLARAAHEIGLDVHRPSMTEHGPKECRDATRVFNQMQARIQQQLDDRDRFVAAVSHDLRTPLTRLALRSEDVVDARLRQAFASDIAQMNEMITTTLDYLRGEADAEPWVRLDLGSLVQSLVDDHRAVGREVAMSGGCAPVRAQVSALRRCIGNLVDNALRYAGSAHIRLGEMPDGSLCVTVLDEGPGIPAAELQKVLAPFYRLEGSRNRGSGGVGLGLSIAADIAKRHGGRIELSANAPAGLAATLVLPRG